MDTWPNQEALNKALNFMSLKNKNCPNYISSCDASIYNLVFKADSRDGR